MTAMKHNFIVSIPSQLEFWHLEIQKDPVCITYPWNKTIYPISKSNHTSIYVKNVSPNDDVVTPRRLGKGILWAAARRRATTELLWKLFPILLFLNTHVCTSWKEAKGALSPRKVVGWRPINRRMKCHLVPKIPSLKVKINCIMIVSSNLKMFSSYAECGTAIAIWMHVFQLHKMAIASFFRIRF